MEWWSLGQDEKRSYWLLGWLNAGAGAQKPGFCLGLSSILLLWGSQSPLFFITKVSWGYGVSKEELSHFDHLLPALVLQVDKEINNYGCHLPSSAVIPTGGLVKGNLAPDLCLAGLLHSHFCIFFFSSHSCASFPVLFCLLCVLYSSRCPVRPRLLGGTLGT